MKNIIYWSLVAAMTWLAFYRGRRDERVAAGICVAASLMSAIVQGSLHDRYSDVELGLLGIDMVTLGAFVTLALQSSRFWPLWIAGLQLSTMIAHLFKGIDGDMMPRVYAIAERFWSYPILLIILIAALRSGWRYAEIDAFQSREPTPSH